MEKNLHKSKLNETQVLEMRNGIFITKRINKII